MNDATATAERGPSGAQPDTGNSATPVAEEPLPHGMPTWPCGGAVPLDEHLRRRIAEGSPRLLLAPLRLTIALGAATALAALAAPGPWLIVPVLATLAVLPVAMARQRDAHQRLFDGETEVWKARVTDLGLEDEPQNGPLTALRSIVEGAWPGSVQDLRIQATFGELVVANRGQRVPSGPYRLVIRPGFDHLVLAGDGGVWMLPWTEAG